MFFLFPCHSYKPLCKPELRSIAQFQASEHVFKGLRDITIFQELSKCFVFLLFIMIYLAEHPLLHLKYQSKI